MTDSPHSPIHQRTDIASIFQPLASLTTVLIVDDSEDDRFTYSRYLLSDTDYTYRIIETETLEEGLELWRSQRPNIVLLDMNLPDGNGLEFLEALSENYPTGRSPAILLTGQGDEQTAVQAMKLGAADYLVKGNITATSLVTCVSQVREREMLALQLARSQHQQTVIAEMALRIRQSLNLKEVLESIVRELREFLVADRAIVYKFNPDMSGTIAAEAIVPPWRSCLNEQIADTCFQGNLGGGYREGRFFTAADIYTANLTDCHTQLLEQFQVRANLVMPILLPNAETKPLWGLLIVHQCSAPRQWEEMDIRLLQQLSVQLAIAIQQAELYQTLQTLNTSLEQKVEERTNALAASEANSRAVLEAIPDLLIRIGADGVYRELATPYREVATFPPDLDVIGRSIAEVLPPEIAEQKLYYLQQAMQTGELQIYEERVQEGDRLKYKEVRIIKRGEDEALFMMRDISDRKQAEFALHELNYSLEHKVEERTARLSKSEAQIRAIVETIPDLLLHVTRDGSCLNFRHAQHSAEVYFPIQQHLSEVLLPELLHQQLDAIDRAISTGQPQVYEHSFHKNDRLVYEEVRVVGINQDEALVIVRNISDRKQIELDLLESQRFIQKIADAAPIILYLYDVQEQRNVYTSQDIASNIGYTPAEIQAMGAAWLPSLMHPDDLSQASIHHEQLQKAQDGEIFTIEYRLRHTNGEWRWFDSRDSIFSRDAEGRVKLIIGAAQDITDRKQNEQEKLFLKERLQFLIASNPAVIYSCKPDGNNETLFMSENVEAILGYKPEEFIAQISFWDSHIHPDDAPKVLAEFPTLFEHGIHKHEYRFLHRDGHYVWLRDELRLMRDERGNPIEIIGYFADISDRKQVEEAFWASERRYSTLAQAAPVGIFQFDAPLNCVYANDRWSEMAGRPIESALGRGWMEALHPDDRDLLIAQYEQGLTEPNPKSQILNTGEGRHLRPDGSINWFYVQVAPEIDAAGNTIGYIGTLTDITDRKQTELLLQQTNEDLIRATRLKDEFLANMSHELRTPLNAILGFSEVLQEQRIGLLNVQQMKAIATVEKSGRHLLALINDILDLSKIASGKTELELTSVSVKQLCDSSFVFVKQQAFQKSIQAIAKIPANIGNITVDERRIKQVLINLLTNAVKFTPNGGQIELLVAFGCGDTWQGKATIPSQFKTLDSPTILFQVADTGIGIAPDDLPKLFQSFIQVDSSLNRQYEGTGLGLAMVKTIAELHGGQVAVESRLGEGSCFTVALPYQISLSTSSVPEPIATTPPLTEARPDNEIAPLILLAEDNESNIHTFTAYLTGCNYRTIVAKNGEEAVALAKMQQPDIILMDMQMPVMDGLEAIRRIRANEQLASIPIVALTALAMEGDREICLEAGANEYLSKPVKLKQLNAIIQQFLFPH
ncbi:hypothetical protein TUMEXPCC7403_02915 [Tumidithrix helvetica PCC 7403]|uniref:PAS domain S-box protein n=1 Tax=Tumidithrix helvetica TaxID=3457545 RepID=UPI003C88F3B6